MHIQLLLKQYKFRHPSSLKQGSTYWQVSRHCTAIQHLRLTHELLNIQDCLSEIEPEFQAQAEKGYN